MSSGYKKIFTQSWQAAICRIYMQAKLISNLTVQNPFLKLCAMLAK